MKSFIDKHESKITGIISIFDRIIFKGYLPLGYPEAVENFLNSCNILIKDFKMFAKTKSNQILDFAKSYADKHNRTFKYYNKKIRKEEEARKIAEAEGITEGLVCVFSVLEQNKSFSMRYGKNKPRLAPCYPRCMTLYFYFIDREFGFIHIRLQAWLPYSIQIYVNGHEWLAKELDKEGIGYTKIDNAFIQIDDCERAQEIADKFSKRRWEKKFDVFANRINPLMEGMLQGFKYYWVTDQAEYATDIMFESTDALKELYTKLQRHATVCFSAEDILTFLGRKLHGNFLGEVQNDYKKRLPGARVKHRMKGNWIKMYDKLGCVLRVETVINHPYEFLIRRRGMRKGEKVIGWFPMAKRVSNLYRYAEVSLAANRKYIEALSVVDDPTDAFSLIEQLCEPAKLNGKRKRGLNPIRHSEAMLFMAAMRGEYFIHGFRNAHVAEHLGVKLSEDKVERRRQSSRIGRLLQLLRAHRLIAKVPRSHRYHVTLKGFKFMSAIVHFREEYLPHHLSTATV